ncbi:MAG: molybdopterin-dependent oxidoreductase [Campylobacterales bacterium]|nr:molybdopterin-dependent oxidoreductase [Campylobacterales bacterium]
MKVEISRRKFLQGSVAMTVFGGSAVTVPNLFSNEPPQAKPALFSKTGTGEAQEIPTLCEMCVNKCAALARVENGVVTKLDPNPLFPKSKNMLCPRGNAAISALYDPDRLKYPMIRIGERGEGKFQRVTWDEAYNYIMQKTLKILDEEQDNRSSFLFCAGEGMAEHTFKSFYEAFGSANWLNHSSICLQTVASAYGVTIGKYPEADLENADYVIMAGANRAEAIVTPDTMDLFKRTKNRGAKLVCIDPRFTNTAAKADLWLPIKPGTDLAFVLALTYVVLTEELYNKSYVEAYFNDFELYRQNIVENQYTPEWAQTITGIDAKHIYQVARDFMAHAPRAVYYPGRRSTFAKNDFQLRRAMAIFQALGGGIDTKGGLIFGKQFTLKGHETLAPLYERAQGRALGKPRNHDRGHTGYHDCAIVTGGGSWIQWRNRFLDNDMPYNVRGMYIYKHNPIINTPGSAKTIEMFKKMELIVCIDTMPSDTVMYSDVILPECHYLERTDPVKTFGGAEPSIAQRNKVVEPMYETKPVRDILRSLTRMLSRPMFDITKKYDESVQAEIAEYGEEEVFKQFDINQPFREHQEHLNEHEVSAYPGAAEALRTKGVYYPDMEQYFKQISVNDFEYYPENKRYYSIGNGKPLTPSGKIECNLNNLVAKGIDPMPKWRQEYEYIIPQNKFLLLTGRHAQFTQSSTRNNAKLRDLMIENFLWINKRVAQKMDIAFGETVEVSSSMGSLHIKAYPTEKIAPDQLFFIHGFGEESEALTWSYQNGANDNAIIEDHVEPVYGSAAMHETFVEIKKV